MTGGSPLAFSGESARLEHPSGRATLISGTSFCISDELGDIDPHHAQGWFAADVRWVSRLRVTIDGHRLEPLGWSRDGPARGWFIARVPGEPTVVIRRRDLDDGFCEQISIHHFGHAVRSCLVHCELESDRASVFAVKERRAAPPSPAPPPASRPAEPRITFDQPVARDQRGATWAWRLAPGESRHTTLTVETPPPAHPWPAPGPSGRPFAAWRAGRPHLTSDWPALDAAVAHGLDDLGALRIPDPSAPDDRTVPAAGAPWFMTLFGRDSLIASWMALPFDPQLALHTLAALAALQATQWVPSCDAAPGKILHELRAVHPARVDHDASCESYYGSVDATPLFVMLHGEALRWLGPHAALIALLPAVDRALHWITAELAASPHGFLSYARAGPHGLANQGWKDSWDGIRGADGSVAAAPLALCEVQGYAYAAFVARARVAAALGDDAAAQEWSTRAGELAARFDAWFWMPDEGTYAVALDGEGRQVRSVTSNAGHCLWTGIARPDRAVRVARRLLHDDMFTGWGLRTLSAANPGHDPLSYHCGSVWPHDTAIAALGMVRTGSADSALRLIHALIDTAEAHGGHLPELFAGFARHEIPFPVAYPSSCSPQAWAAAAPLACVRALLRLEPEVDQGRVGVDPVAVGSDPHRRFTQLRLTGMTIGTGECDIGVHGGHAALTGLPPGCIHARPG